MTNGSIISDTHRPTNIDIHTGDKKDGKDMELPRTLDYMGVKSG